MISKEEFMKMNFESKGYFVFKMGDYISTRSYYNFNVNLYSLFGFLVQVWYFCPDNKIERIELLNSNKEYVLYANNVKLDSLNNDTDEKNFF
jgi:hypothetical protein